MLMDTATSVIFGLLFLTLGFAAVFLMFRIWGYPFDEAAHKSSAPRFLVVIHRVVGVSYVLLYLLMMSQMVPRLFEYQVEFQVRTVAHMMLGVSIGLLLVLKFSILRAFRHFSGALPYIGTAILWCTVMLVSLSVPFALKEVYWSSGASGGSAFSQENIDRVRTLLPTAGFPPQAPIADLASESNLRSGREVLLSRCVACHDLKTVLMRPRTPSNWVRTVERMAQRPIFGKPIQPSEQWAVASYLIAISPDLQSTAKRRRGEEERAIKTRAALTTAIVADDMADWQSIDPEEARGMFTATCSQCHELSEVQGYPLDTEQDVQDLLERMVGNGLDATAEEMKQIGWYLTQTFVGSR